MGNQEYFEHVAEQALHVGTIGMEAENLHLAIEEVYEAEVMYRDFQGPGRGGRRPAGRQAVPAPA